MLTLHGDFPKQGNSRDPEGYRKCGDYKKGECHGIELRIGGLLDVEPLSINEGVELSILAQVLRGWAGVCSCRETVQKSQNCGFRIRVRDPDSPFVLPIRSHKYPIGR